MIATQVTKNEFIAAIASAEIITDFEYYQLNRLDLYEPRGNGFFTRSINIFGCLFEYTVEAKVIDGDVIQLYNKAFTDDDSWHIRSYDISVIDNGKELNHEDIKRILKDYTNIERIPNRI